MSGPEPQLAVEMHRTLGGHGDGAEPEWQVTARWWWHNDEPPPQAGSGPRETVITLLPGASARTRHRGVNSSVLRRAETVVAEMAKQMRDEWFSDVPVNAADYAAQVTKKMPPGPRGGGDNYYIGLLHSYDQLVDAGFPNPLHLLAGALDKPEATIKTQLRTARKVVPWWETDAPGTA